MAEKQWADGRLVVELRARPELTAELGGKVVGHTVPPYEGSYTVIPAPDEQLLPTAQKYMSDDVTVRAIPYYVVSNDQGGQTTIIGRSLNDYGN